MTIDRRTFIVGTGVAAVSPGLQLWSLQLPARAAAMSRAEFMIEGWSVRDASAATEQVWLRLDRTWRTAWR
jgi:hypothetical protein